MKKYLLFIPLIGIFIPSTFENWSEYYNENPIKINIAMIIQIITIFIMFIIFK